MSVVIGTLCLNEMEWLPRLYEQHKNWPGLESWVFVEAADRIYANTNPELVNEQGLSVDGTSEFLAELSRKDDRIVYIAHGFSDHEDPAQGKCEARSRYMEEAERIRPQYILALDADEFYTLLHQSEIHRLMVSLNKEGLLIGYHNIWRPPSIREHSLMELEVVGKFWSIGVCKLWKWFPGLCYNGNHNAPYHDGVYSNRNMKFMTGPNDPKFVHMGFASFAKFRNAKNQYYSDRGELQDTPHYVRSRGAFRDWKPGDELPNGDKVIPYMGPIPEVFRA